MILWNMINSFSKTDDFIKMIDLLSKTGLGRSGHVRFPTSGPISHALGSKLVFDEIYKWFCMVFAGEAQKTRYFYQKP